MKRIFLSHSGMSFLSLGLLLVASALAGAVWSRSQRATQQPGTVKQTSHDAAAQPDAATKARLNEAYGQLPLSFEANVGQTDSQVDFISRGSGYTLFLTPREAVLAVPPTGDDHQSAVLRMKFAGSEANPRVAGHNELPGKINYFRGNDPSRWSTGISTFAKVAYENVYPGIDLVYYGNHPASISGSWTSATFKDALDQRAGSCLRRLDSRQHLRPEPRSTDPVWSISESTCRTSVDQARG